VLDGVHGPHAVSVLQVVGLYHHDASLGQYALVSAELDVAADDATASKLTQTRICSTAALPMVE